MVLPKNLSRSNNIQNPIYLCKDTLPMNNTMDSPIKEFRYDGTKRFYFRLSDAFMPEEYVDTYGAFLPIGVDLTCAEFHELFESYCNWFDSGEYKTYDDLRGEEPVYQRLPSINAKVVAAIRAQAPTYYDEGIIPFLDDFNVNSPWEFQIINDDISEGRNPMVAQTFDIHDDGDLLSRCSVFSEGRLIVPDGVKKLEIAAFKACTRVTEIVMADSVESMESMTFMDCYSLRAIRLSKRLRSIPMSTFEWCCSMVELTIPNTVERIDRYAFDYCIRLEKLTILSSRCSFAEEVFFGCSALKEIHLSLDSIADIDNIFPERVLQTGKLYVPAERLDDYRRHRHFGLFKTILPE